MELMRVKIRRRRMNRKRGDNNLLRIRKDKKGWEMGTWRMLTLCGRWRRGNGWAPTCGEHCLLVGQPTAGNFPVVAGGGEGGDRGEGTLVTFDGMGRPRASREITGLGQKVVPRLRECCRQSQAEVVSNSRNKIHQTWGPGPPFSRALYVTGLKSGPQVAKIFQAS